MRKSLILLLIALSPLTARAADLRFEVGTGGAGFLAAIQDHPVPGGRAGLGVFWLSGPGAAVHLRYSTTWGPLGNVVADLDAALTPSYWSVQLAGRAVLGPVSVRLRGGTWNILNGTAHPTEAFQFVQHITSTEGSYSFNLVGNQGAFVRPDVMQQLIETNPTHEWFLVNLENGLAAHAPANSRGREYTDAVAQYAALLFDPTQPVEFDQGLEALHDSIQTVLDMDPA